MKALTIKQPWAWAIVHSSKKVENRGWKPSPKLVGQRFAIHAAKVDDDGGFLAIKTITGETLAKDAVFRSAIIGTARLVGVATSGYQVPAHTSRWWGGPIGFLLSDVIACDPFPCKGALGFWETPSGFVDPYTCFRCGGPCDGKHK